MLVGKGEGERGEGRGEPGLFGSRHRSGEAQPEGAEGWGWDTFAHQVTRARQTLLALQVTLLLCQTRRGSPTVCFLGVPHS